MSLKDKVYIKCNTVTSWPRQHVHYRVAMRQFERHDSAAPPARPRRRRRLSSKHFLLKQRLISPSSAAIMEALTNSH